MEKLFKALAVQYDVRDTRMSVFSIDDDPGKWIDLYDDTIDIISWDCFSIRGIPDVSENVPCSGIQIGSIFGCNVPVGLIENLYADPYEVCDAADADLEAMYSVILEYELKEMDDNIYYIREIELKPECQGLGYEAAILQQLPAIIVTALHVFPSLLMYYPAPTQQEEPERDREAEDILVHRLEYNMQGILKSKRTDNIALFPPKIEVSEEREIRELNRRLGKRNPGTTLPMAHRNQSIYNLYKSAGFMEVGQTGWLYKRIANIFTKDGMNY